MPTCTCKEFDGNANNPFAEEALERTRAAVSAAFAQTTHDRDAVAVEACEVDMDSIMTLLGHLNSDSGLPASSSASAVKKAADPSGAVEVVEDDDEDDDVSGKHETLAERVAKSSGLKKGGPKAAANPKAKSNPSQGASNKPNPTKAADASAASAKRPTQTPSQATAAGPVQDSANAAQKKPNANAAMKGGKTTTTSSIKETAAATLTAAAGVLNLDGRGLRLKQSLSQTVAECKRSVSAVLAFQDDYAFQDKKPFQAKQKVFTSAAGTLATNLKKAENSPNKAGVEEQIADLQSLADHVAALGQFNAALHAKEVTSEQMRAALDSVLALPSDMAPKLGSAVWLHILQVSCSHHLMYREFDAYAALYKASSLEAD